MSAKKRKSYSPKFKIEAVNLIMEKGYSISDASRSLGAEYSVLRRWNKQFAIDPERAFRRRGRLALPGYELRWLRRELERVKQK